MANEKDKELDKILSEVKETKAKAETEKKEDYAERKKKKKNDKRKKEQKQKEQKKERPKNQKSKEELKGALDIEDEPLAFAKRSKIVENESDIEVSKKKPAKKHIEIGEAEVIEDEKANESEENETSEKEVFAGDEKPVYTKVEMPKTARAMKKKTSKKQRKTALLGLLMSVFVIVGVITTLIGLFNAGRYIFTSAAKKEELARVVYPLVIVDVPEFDDPTKLDNSVVVSTAIWDFLLSDSDKSKYERDDFGSMFVPSTDIEAQIRKLYGNDVVVHHQTNDDMGIVMLYDAENDRYIIESSPKYVSYIPRVDKIRKKDGIYTLTVSYVSPDALWTLYPNSAEQKVLKINEFRLKKTKTGYQFLSSKLLDVVGLERQDNVPSDLPSFDYESFETELESDLNSDETLSDEQTTTSDVSDAGGESGSAESSAESSKE